MMVEFCVRDGCKNPADRQCTTCENYYCSEHMSDKDNDVCNWCIKGNLFY